jgi:magnesium chelatase family protein
LIRDAEPSTLGFVSSIARIPTFAFAGIEAVPVEVQVQLAQGLPAFLVVGLPDKAVAESKERVRAALTAIGLSLPPKRVIVNLAPADLLKEGSHFDLPIALGVLAAMEVIPRDAIAEFAALGELALDGTLAPVAGVLPAAIGAGARELGLICPGPQGPEAAWAGTVEVLAPADLPALHARLAALDADVVKIATMANHPTDNLRMLELVASAKVPTVGICMGD